MDTDDPTVANLLQQLEELKRRRAHKIKKLEKLKKLSADKRDNIVAGIPCQKVKDVSPLTSSNSVVQKNSETKCAKCNLILISKDSPCIKCLNANHKGNNHQKKSETIVAAIGVELTNSENKSNLCLNLDRNNDLKHVKESLNKQNLTHETLKINHDHSVLKSSSNSRTLVDPHKTPTNHRSRPHRLQRKRSTTLDHVQDDYKKLKLSTEIAPVKSSPMYSCSANVDHFKEGSATSSVGACVSNEWGKKLQPPDNATMTRNRSGYYSPSGLFGRYGGGTDADNQLLSTESEKCQKKDELDLKSSEKGRKGLSSFITKETSASNNDEANNSIKTINHTPPAYQFTLDKPIPKSKALSEKGVSVQKINTSLLFNRSIEKVPNTFSETGTPQSKQNLKTVQQKAEIEVSTPQHEKKNDINDGSDNTFHDASKVKSEKNVAKVYPHSLFNSQLIEDLKTSNFSSFDNSNSAKTSRPMWTL